MGDIPKSGQRWKLKSDHSKVLIVNWVNTCDYVQFEAPWMVRRPTTLKLDKFLERYQLETEPRF
jgi:hypothetical protein